VTGVSGTKYDFTNMTNAQAYAAAGKLGDEGKITVGEQAQLQIMAAGGGREIGAKCHHPAIEFSVRD